MRCEWTLFFQGQSLLHPAHGTADNIVDRFEALLAEQRGGRLAAAAGGTDHGYRRLRVEVADAVAELAQGHQLGARHVSLRIFPRFTYINHQRCAAVAGLQQLVQFARVDVDNVTAGERQAVGFPDIQSFGQVADDTVIAYASQGVDD